MLEDQIVQTPPASVGNGREGPEPVTVAESSRRLIELASRVAASDCTVLIGGESGTGKEVLARYIHRQSTRAARPFIAVNCAAIPETMLEALLFGYERGAFTGAHQGHPGKFEQAQGGTLLLDEVSEMPVALQAKLLRVLQEREVERLGGRCAVALDVRVIGTTNRQLRTEVAAGRFREDLYYRLNVFPLTLLPLRERRDDILPIATQLLALRVKPGRPIPALSADAAHVLLTHAWPGNARELDNVLQRALILCSGPVILPEHLEIEYLVNARCAPAVDVIRVRSAAAGDSADAVHEAGGVLARSRERAEREMLLRALSEPQSTRQAVAERLGISPRTLRYKLARLRAAGVAIPAV
jgi:two-component system response regulator FlrC